MTDSPTDRATRLARERHDADRLYNEALTRLDRALAAAMRVPEVPPPYDRSLLDDINAKARWDILPSGAPAPAGGWRGWLTAFVWRLVGPALEQQRALNAAMVDHLNRNAAGHAATHRALADLVVAVGAQAEARASFDSRLIQFLQQITAFVESKDRELAAAVAEVRAVAELSQRSSMMAKREVERYGTHVAQGFSPAPAPAAPPASPAAGASDAYKYVGFEDLFRGSEDEIRARMRDYVPVFAGATDVLDIGCGRGELLALLKEAGIQARGLDLNHEMVEMCRERGLDAAEGDALDYLSGLADESLGGLIASQVVEHFEPGYLLRFLEVAYHKLRPGSKIVLETINPACWVAFFESYIRDLTHVRPLHPETLKFLLLSSGYATVDIVFRAPVPESGRLQPVTEPPVPPGTPDDAPVRRLVEWARTCNANVDRLNERMFTHLDYAAIGHRT